MTYATEQRRNVDRYLPTWSQEELDIVKFSSDFYGMNHYTSSYVFPQMGGSSGWGRNDDNQIWASGDGTREVEYAWDIQYPDGIYQLLKQIAKNYGNPPILITENGNAEPADWNQIYDTGRVRYITEYMSKVHLAIEEGVNVIGYTVWSLMDNFEWSAGYSARFGMIHVDFDSEERTRTRKQSFYCYQDIIKNNAIGRRVKQKQDL